MFSRFFINRPIFAAVVSIVIVLGGLLTLVGLPISQYPTIEPPTVNVTANYPGASADVVAETVAQPIEQQVNGVEGMLYMSSNSASDGSYSLTVTFETGVDQDMATVLVQNRVAVATPLAARRGQAPGRDHQEEIAQLRHVHQPGGQKRAL